MSNPIISNKYESIVRKLHPNPNNIFEFIEVDQTEEEKKKPEQEQIDTPITRILESLHHIDSVLPNISVNHLLTYATVFSKIEDNDADTFKYFLSNTHKGANATAKFLDQFMTWAYLAFNFFYIVVNIDALITELGKFSLQLSSHDGLITDITTYTWNYIDTIGPLGIALQFYLQGEYLLALANFFSSIQLLTCTVLANIAKYSHVLQLSTSTLAGLTGFSFAAAMAISCMAELYSAYQTAQYIHALETQLTQTSAAERQRLEKAILIETAKYQNHMRCAISWGGCALAMSVVSIIAFLAATGASGGAVLGIAIGVAAFAFLTGLIRKWWLQRENYLENAITSLKKENNQDSLWTELNIALGKLDDHIKKILIPAPSFSIFKTITFENYLKKLAADNPKKLRAILDDIDRLTISKANKTTGAELLQKLGIKEHNEFNSEFEKTILYSFS